MSARYQKKAVDVKGLAMSYIESGEGDPIVFLHGNPTSSIVWRNIIPYLEGQGHCIAPDLIGMGDSGKLKRSGPASYSFREHREYLDAFLSALDINKNVVLVLHDWGSALGFDWANRHRGALKGIAYMEAIVCQGRWDEIDDPFKSFLKAVRSTSGEQMILIENLFLKKMFPKMVVRSLTDDEMAAYQQPFIEPGEGRRPMLSWPRQIVLDGEPEDVAEVIYSYADWMSTSDVPKLFVNADPGMILVEERRKFCRSWKNQSEITVVGKHILQEDSPYEIGAAIAKWVGSIG